MPKGDFEPRQIKHTSDPLCDESSKRFIFKLFLLFYPHVLKCQNSHRTSKVPLKKRRVEGLVPARSVVAQSSSWNGVLATSSLEKLEEGEKRWEAPDHLQIVLSQNCDGTESNHTVACFGLKATANDRRTTSPLPWASI
ncbi:hypothetical protein TNCV_4381561 [Trichonephila clavipes]|nr:hypothetical protein TNCV_4381561 [Trichonephila clavipes]